MNSMLDVRRAHCAERAAALARAVELGDYDAGELHRVVELPGLLAGDLAGVRVYDQQLLVRLELVRLSPSARDISSPSRAFLPLVSQMSTFLSFRAFDCLAALSSLRPSRPLCRRSPRPPALRGSRAARMRRALRRRRRSARCPGPCPGRTSRASLRMVVLPAP